MKPLIHRTKIVATLGPASRSREIVTDMVKAGMSVARLNFSHGDHDDHAQMVRLIRSVSKLDESPLTSVWCRTSLQQSALWRDLLAG